MSHAFPRGPLGWCPLTLMHQPLIDMEDTVPDARSPVRASPRGMSGNSLGHLNETRLNQKKNLDLGLNE